MLNGIFRITNRQTGSDKPDAVVHLEQLLHDLLRLVQTQQIRGGGRPLTAEELRLLRAYGDPSRPFSLLISSLLAKLEV